MQQGGQGGQGQGGNYSHYYAQYMQGGQGQGGQGGQGGDYSHYYSQYMQQGGTRVQAQNKSGTGFQRYLDRYLPPGDGKYTNSYTLHTAIRLRLRNPPGAL